MLTEKEISNEMSFKDMQLTIMGQLHRINSLEIRNDNLKNQLKDREENNLFLKIIIGVMLYVLILLGLLCKQQQNSIQGKNYKIISLEYSNSNLDAINQALVLTNNNISDKLDSLEDWRNTSPEFRKNKIEMDLRDRLQDRIDNY